MISERLRDEMVVWKDQSRPIQEMMDGNSTCYALEENYAHYDLRSQSLGVAWIGAELARIWNSEI